MSFQNSSGEYREWGIGNGVGRNHLLDSPFPTPHYRFNHIFATNRAATRCAPSSKSSWSKCPAAPARDAGSSRRVFPCCWRAGASATWWTCRSTTRSRSSTAIPVGRGLAGGVDPEIAGPILKEIRDRLVFLRDVGLEYLTLGRSAGTLSGGEAQRIRLATQIGSRLVGVLYVLDEPSIGLHQRDNARLLRTLRELRDLGNTVIVVEHDEDTIRAADHVIDLGPRAGNHGGEVVAEGTIDADSCPPRLAHRAVPPRGAPDSGAPGCGAPAIPSGASGWSAPAATTCGISPSKSRSGCSWR